MSITKVDGGIGELLRALPTDLQPLSVKNVDHLVDGTKVYVQGRILTKLQLQKTKSLQFLKLVIKDDTNPSVESEISVFLAGEIASKGATLEKDYVLAVSGFIVENATQGVVCQHSYQIILDSTNSHPKIWYVPHKQTRPNPAGNAIATTSSRTNRKTTSKAVPKPYTYTVLNDVQSNVEINIYAVVKFCKPPHRSRGSDYCMILSLVDPSLSTLDDKLKCLLFNRDEKCLPSVSVGSIVRFHRLRINTFKGEKQGQSSPGFSWLVFNKQIASSLEPRASSSSNYTLTDQDKEKVRELQQWLDSQEQLKNVERHFCISEISPGIYFDLTCQVISTCIIEEGECVLLQIWDGTKTIYPVREIDTDREDYYVHTDCNIADIADGVIYDVCVFDDHYTAAKEIKPGQYIKICNLHAALLKNVGSAERMAALPTVEFVLHRGTSYGRGLGVLASDSDEVKDIDVKLTKFKNNKKQFHPSTKNNSETGSMSVGTKAQNTDKSCVLSDLEVDLSQDAVKAELGIESTNSCFSPGTSRVSQRRRRSESLNNSFCDSFSTSSKKNNSVDMDESDLQLTCDDLPNTCSVQSSSDRCMMETATVVLNHPHVKLTKLDRILSHEVPYKFRIQCQIVDYYPHADTKEDFIKLYCQSCHYLCGLQLEDKQGLTRSKKCEEVHYRCPSCIEIDEQSDQCLNYIYMMRFLLSDGFNWLVAHLWQQDAITFFKDTDPISVLSRNSLFSDIQDNLKQICPANVAFVNKPFIECCIKSYKMQSGTAYQIFDTCIT